VPTDGRVGNKRVFDRHLSGTGRGKEVSKGGAGGRNWGSADDEVRAATGGEAAAEGEAAPAAAGEGAAEAEVAAAPEPEEVDNTKTYEEYQKELAAKRAGALFATSSAKADTSGLMKQFAGAQVKQVVRVEMDEEDAEIFAGKIHGATKEEEEGEEEAEAGNGGAADLRKELLRFRIGGAGEGGPRREGGERGGRGGGRGAGRGGRGGFRSEGREGGEGRPERSERPERAEGGEFRGRGRGRGAPGAGRGRGGAERGAFRGAPRGAPAAAR
jgi:hypothetical protein